MDALLTQLCDAPLFEAVDDNARTEILSTATVRALEAGQMLFLQGEPADAFYLVGEGSVKLVQSTPDGREMIVRFIRAGEIIAAVALMPTGRYPVSAVAAESSRIAVWSGERIRAWVGLYPVLRANIMTAMAMHMQDALSQGRELATSKVPQRLAAMLLRLAERHGVEQPDGTLIEQALSREQIAEMTGTTLFTVSRTLSEWQDAGIVSTRKRHIVIHDRTRLTALSSAE